jgi:hypothetical protein
MLRRLWFFAALRAECVPRTAAEQDPGTEAGHGQKVLGLEFAQQTCCYTGIRLSQEVSVGVQTGSILSRRSGQETGMFMEIARVVQA